MREGRAPVVGTNMRKTQVKVFLRQARLEATLTMKKLDKAGVLDDADDMARAALHEALVVMRGPTTAKDKLTAARLVLDFTKAKPASKQEIQVSTAEAWLEEVTQDNAKESGEADHHDGDEAGPETEGSA